MTWAKLDDGITTHPKFLRLSDGAYRLWSNGLIHCNRYTTDGLIAKDILKSLDHRGMWSPKQLAGFVLELLAVVAPHSFGLWIDTGSHYRIHEYEEHQREAMKDRVEEKKRFERERKAAQRSRNRGESPSCPSGTGVGQPVGQDRGTREGQTRDMARDKTDARADLSQGVSPPPTRPDPTQEHASMQSDGDSGEVDTLASAADFRSPVQSAAPLTRLDVLKNFAENIAEVRGACGLPKVQPFIAEMAGAKIHQQAQVMADACIAQSPDDPVAYFMGQLEGVMGALQSRGFNDKNGKRVTDPWAYFRNKFGTWGDRHAA